MKKYLGGIKKNNYMILPSNYLIMSFSMKATKENILAIKNMSEEFFNEMHEGGAQIICVNYNWYVLFEIPQYGGEPIYNGTYHQRQIDDIITLIETWT